mmetsp:Transcript_32789/g.76590  ORF Transcript_32789/g.76590 Transcript_32789/m.76590 type:complete len:90 (+) Transcript_32789:401-670(+)
MQSPPQQTWISTGGGVSAHDSFAVCCCCRGHGGGMFSGEGGEPGSLSGSWGTEEGNGTVGGSTSMMLAFGRAQERRGRFGATEWGATME